MNNNGKRFNQADSGWVCAGGNRYEARSLYPNELSESTINGSSVQGSRSLMTGVGETRSALLAGSAFSGGANSDKSAVFCEATKFVPKNDSRQS
jgi:hypothetical protein